MNRNTLAMIERLRDAGISLDDALALRRISMTLQRWHEHECNGCITRDKATDKPMWCPRGGTPWRIPDRELGARKRLYNIMRRYPALRSYVQKDPRGAALYILHRSDVPEDGYVSDYYDRGIAVFK